MSENSKQGGTLHNSAKPGDIAQTILLPGDPLRARFIAEGYLDNPKQYNSLRGMYGFTGTFQGREISVQGTGMGGPSMAIYSHELIHHYGVKTLIRIGSAGALQEELSLGDIVLASAASTDSGMPRQFLPAGTLSPSADVTLLLDAYRKAQDMSLPVTAGAVLSSDFFYHPDGLESLRPWQSMGLLAVEMEAASLYLNAMRGKARALCMLTITDKPFSHGSITPEEREKGLLSMIELALFLE